MEPHGHLWPRRALLPEKIEKNSPHFFSDTALLDIGPRKCPDSSCGHWALTRAVAVFIGARGLRAGKGSGGDIYGAAAATI